MSRSFKSTASAQLVVATVLGGRSGDRFDGDIGDLRGRQDVLIAFDVKPRHHTALGGSIAGDGDPKRVVEPGGPAVAVAGLGDHLIDALARSVG